MKTHASWQAEYEATRAAAVPVESELLDRLIKACQKNHWLKVGGADFEPDGFCCEHDYPYILERSDGVGMLERFFAHGNWAIRAAVQHHDLFFVNQINGGDEWWTLKIDCDQLLRFESIIFRHIIARGEFPSYVQRLRDATVEQCKNVAY
jgi:hypothetical protein